MTEYDKVENLFSELCELHCPANTKCLWLWLQNLCKKKNQDLPNNRNLKEKFHQPKWAKTKVKLNVSFNFNN